MSGIEQANERSESPDSKDEPKVQVKKVSVVKGNKFSGDGVTFRAKLFGTADVKEPRGDPICNTAMNLLKSAVKNTGEHKQKIVIRINMNGITLIDGATQANLYQHPVNRISFIAKDPNDSRAFGYIVADTDKSHMYFGIKTEKAADQVVVALKELFQTVFEMKKKEAEMKGKEDEKATTASKPADTTDKATSSEAKAGQAEQKPSAEEPSLGEETTVKKEESSQVKREDSQSHLLDLIENLTFDTPTPAVSNGGNAWNSAQQSPWGNPAQNDPFATQTSSFGGQQQQQQPPFGQQSAFGQPTQTSPFQNQPISSYNSPFNQPQQSHFSQSPFSTQQPQQSAFSSSPFTTPQPQQAMYGGQQVFSSAPMSMYQQQPATNTSPFATHTSMTSNQPTMYGNDPFSTSQYQSPFAQQPQSTAMTSPPSSNNPFASGSGEQSAFGVLQPQAIQPTPAPRGNAPTQPNLFSDLNPLPSSTTVRKDQFFSELKNPPKPKLNQLAPSKQEQAPVNNSNVSSLLDDDCLLMPSSECSDLLLASQIASSGSSLLPDPFNSLPTQQQSTNADSQWFDELDGARNAQSNASADLPTDQLPKQGLIPPPPSSLKQRQTQGPAPVARPR